MTKTEYRQFIDEVYFLGKQKEYSGRLNKFILSLNIFKSPKKILLNKRKAYDFALANLFRKYGLNNDNLYDELDKIWDSIDEYEIRLALSPVSIAANIKFYELLLRFDTYIDKTKKYCENFAKGQIDE